VGVGGLAGLGKGGCWALERLHNTPCCYIGIWPGCAGQTVLIQLSGRAVYTGSHSSVKLPCPPLLLGPTALLFCCLMQAGDTGVWPGCGSLPAL
jgi:hypothetical protein